MISYIVPFFNEENFILSTIQEIIIASSQNKIIDFEIILVDDLSNDNSVKLIENFIKQNNSKNIFLFNNSKNLGYGGSVKVGISKAKKKYIMWLPGDNAYNSNELYKIVKHLGNYDVVSSYFENPNQRVFFRRFFTKFYTPFLNFVFGINLPYYCGIVLCKRDIAQNIKINTDSHFFQIEFWVKSFIYKNNLSYRFESVNVKDNPKGSKAFKLKNSLRVFYNFFRVAIYSFIMRIKLYFLHFFKNKNY